MLPTQTASNTSISYKSEHNCPQNWTQNTSHKLNETIPSKLNTVHISTNTQLKTATRSQHWTIRRECLSRVKVKWMQRVPRAVCSDRHTAFYPVGTGDKAAGTTHSNLNTFTQDLATVYQVLRLCGGGIVVSTPTLYSRGPGLKSRPGDRISWLRVFAVFLSPSKKVPGKYLR